MASVVEEACQKDIKEQKFTKSYRECWPICGGVHFRRSVVCSAPCEIVFLGGRNPPKIIGRQKNVGRSGGRRDRRVGIVAARRDGVVENEGRDADDRTRTRVGVVGQRRRTWYDVDFLASTGK